jgi:hypothetical protein
MINAKDIIQFEIRLHVRIGVNWNLERNAYEHTKQAIFNKEHRMGIHGLRMMTHSTRI